MRWNVLLFALPAAAAFFAFAESRAAAQIIVPSVNQAIRQSTTVPTAERGLRNIGRIGRVPTGTVLPNLAPRTRKPKSNIYRRPTVSPFLNLARDDFDNAGLPNYQTLVRPQIQQQEINRRQAREVDRLRNRVNQFSTEIGATQFSDELRPTGNVPSFMNLSHFYPRR